MSAGARALGVALALAVVGGAVQLVGLIIGITDTITTEWTRQDRMQVAVVSIGVVIAITAVVLAWRAPRGPARIAVLVVAILVALNGIAGVVSIVRETPNCKGVIDDQGQNACGTSNAATPPASPPRA